MIERKRLESAFRRLVTLYWASADAQVIVKTMRDSCPQQCAAGEWIDESLIVKLLGGDTRDEQLSERLLSCAQAGFIEWQEMDYSDESEGDWCAYRISPTCSRLLLLADAVDVDGRAEYMQRVIRLNQLARNLRHNAEETARLTGDEKAGMAIAGVADEIDREVSILMNVLLPDEETCRLLEGLLS